jgi:lysozyme
MSMRVLARRLRFLAVAAVLLGLAFFCAWLFVSNWRPSVKDFPVQGVDVSEAQGPIEWWTVRNSGVRFAYIRATTGARNRDLRFAENWRWTFEAGIRRGAIHVFSLCRLAADQAGNFVSVVPRSDDQLPPALELDFQADCPARPDRDVVLGEINNFLAIAETHLGKPVTLRIARKFEARYRVSEDIDRRLWSRQLLFPPYYLARPWTIWQASGLRRVDGMSGPVNWNVMAR